jgi:putative flippase GtrA
MKNLREHLREISTYGICTVIAFGVDLALLTLMVSGLEWNYIAASIISFTLGGVLLYGLAVRVVFRHRRVDNRHLELTYFITIGVVGLGIQTALILFAVQTLHVHYLLAKIGAAGCTVILNFLARRTLLFSPKKPA